MNTIPRKAADGVVRHPLTGTLEYATTDPALAEKIAAALDEHDPVTVAWLFEALLAVHPRERRNAEWVMSSAARNAIRRAANPAGLPMWATPVSPDVPEFLLGQPVVIDEDATGVSLRVQEVAR